MKRQGLILAVSLLLIAMGGISYILPWTAILPFNKNLVRGQIAKSFPGTIVDKQNGFINVHLCQFSKHTFLWKELSK